MKQTAQEIKLAIIDVKLDGLKAVGEERQVKVEAHIIADAEAFKTLIDQMDVLKAFRWQVYGALVVIGAILGAATWVSLFLHK